MSIRLVDILIESWTQKNHANGVITDFGEVSTPRDKYCQVSTSLSISRFNIKDKNVLPE